MFYDSYNYRYFFVEVKIGDSIRMAHNHNKSIINNEYVSQKLKKNKEKHWCICIYIYMLQKLQSKC